MADSINPDDVKPIDAGNPLGKALKLEDLELELHDLKGAAKFAELLHELRRGLPQAPENIAERIEAQSGQVPNQTQTMKVLLQTIQQGLALNTRNLIDNLNPGNVDLILAIEETKKAVLDQLKAMEPDGSLPDDFDQREFLKTISLAIKEKTETFENTKLFPGLEDLQQRAATFPASQLEKARLEAGIQLVLWNARDLQNVLKDFEKTVYRKPGSTDADASTPPPAAPSGPTSSVASAPAPKKRVELKAGRNGQTLGEPRILSDFIGMFTTLPRNIWFSAYDVQRTDFDPYGRLAGRFLKAAYTPFMNYAQTVPKYTFQPRVAERFRQIRLLDVDSYRYIYPVTDTVDEIIKKKLAPIYDDTHVTTRSSLEEIIHSIQEDDLRITNGLEPLRTPMDDVSDAQWIAENLKKIAGKIRNGEKAEKHKEAIAQSSQLLPALANKVKSRYDDLNAALDPIAYELEIALAPKSGDRVDKRLRLPADTPANKGMKRDRIKTLLEHVRLIGGTGIDHQDMKKTKTINRNPAVIMEKFSQDLESISSISAEDIDRAAFSDSLEKMTKEFDEELGDSVLLAREFIDTANLRISGRYADGSPALLEHIRKLKRSIDQRLVFPHPRKLPLHEATVTVSNDENYFIKTVEYGLSNAYDKDGKFIPLGQRQPGYKSKMAEHIANMYRGGREQDALRALRYLRYHEGRASDELIAEGLATEVTSQLKEDFSNASLNIETDKHYRYFNQKIINIVNERDHSPRADGPRDAQKWFIVRFKQFVYGRMYPGAPTATDSGKIRPGQYLATPFKNNYLEHPVMRKAQAAKAFLIGGKVMDISNVPEKQAELQAGGGTLTEKEIGTTIVRSPFAGFWFWAKEDVQNDADNQDKPPSLIGGIKKFFGNFFKRMPSNIQAPFNILVKLPIIASWKPGWTATKTIWKIPNQLDSLGVPLVKFVKPLGVASTIGLVGLGTVLGSAEELGEEAGWFPKSWTNDKGDLVVFGGDIGQRMAGAGLEIADVALLPIRFNAKVFQTVTSPVWGNSLYGSEHYVGWAADKVGFKSLSDGIQARDISLDVFDPALRSWLVSDRFEHAPNADTPAVNSEQPSTNTGNDNSANSQQQQQQAPVVTPEKLITDFAASLSAQLKGDWNYSAGGAVTAEDTALKQRFERIMQGADAATMARILTIPEQDTRNKEILQEFRRLVAADIDGDGTPSTANDRNIYMSWLVAAGVMDHSRLPPRSNAQAPQAPNAPAVPVAGDIDGNGVLDSSDLNSARVLNEAFKILSDANIELSEADLNGDGALTLEDLGIAQKIAQARNTIAGLTGEFSGDLTGDGITDTKDVEAARAIIQARDAQAKKTSEKTAENGQNQGVEPEGPG